jgi:hypothetical protein
MSAEKSSEPAKKRQRRPREMSASATASASNLKNIDQPNLTEMHRSIKETMVGNHELLANAAKASAPPTVTSSARAGGVGTEMLPAVDQVHSRELTRIVFQAGYQQIGVNNSHVAACCQGHAERFQPPSSEQEREQLAMKFAKKPLKQVMLDMMLRMRNETPNITKQEAVQRASQTIDAELHRLQHLYELEHGIPGIDGIEMRFKSWLGVRPGATQNEIEAALREKHPDERPSRISGMARVQMLTDERKKKSAYQIHVSDDKIQQMLLRAYTRHGDREAGDILMQFRERQIRLQSASAEEATRRLEEVRLEMTSALEKARKIADTPALLSAADAMQQDVAQDTPLTVKGFDAATGNLVSAEGVIVEPGIHGPAEFLRAYNQDLSAAPERVRESHCSAMVNDLMSSINLMAELLAVAPPDAVFAVAGACAGDAIDNLYALLQMGASDSENTDENEESPPRMGRLSSDTLHLYMDQWQRVQSESQSDIDRELARAHKHEEAAAVVAQLMKLGVDEMQVRSDLSFGVRPEMSEVYKAITSVSHHEKYAAAKAEAEEVSKLRQKLDQQATSMAREANRASSESGQNGGEKMTKDLALKLLFEKSARMLPEIDRAYRQQFLREPAGAEFFERPCLWGEACVARTKRTVFPMQQLHANLAGTAGGTGGSSTKAVNSGFICREFLLPAQLAEVRATYKLPETIRPCLLCNIYYTTRQCMDFAKQEQGCEQRMPLTLLQDHCVIIDQAGEYAKECTLQHLFANRLPTGIVRPYQAYSDGNWAYSYTIAQGKRLRCLVETDASVFRLPSAKATVT